MSFHLKDFQLTGTNVGFTVFGAPFGSGQIGAGQLLERVFAITSEPEIYLETWTTHTGHRQTDIDTDSRWLQSSIENLRQALTEIGTARR